MRVGSCLDKVASRVNQDFEVSVLVRVEGCRHQHIDAGRHFGLLGNHRAQVAGIVFIVRRKGWVTHRLDGHLVGRQGERGRIRTVQVRRNVDVELFGVGLPEPSHGLRSDVQSEHDFTLSFHVDGKRRVLAVGGMVGAATSILLAPETINLGQLHALTLNSDRPHEQRLVTLQCQFSSKVFSFRVGAQHQAVEL